MQWLRVVFGSALMLTVVGVGLYFVIRKSDHASQNTIPEPTTFVDDFTFPDREGNPVRFDDLRARVRVITFWASWSPYSKTELPALAEIKQTYGDKIDVVALNRDTNPNEGKAFFSALGVGEGVIDLYDSDDTYYRAVGGYNMPETVFVNRDGGILKHVHGPMTAEEVRSTVELLLSQ